jgi:ribosomal protein S18 acetylase RimI-like enzyme
MMSQIFESSLNNTCGLTLREVSLLDEAYLLDLYSSVREAEMAMVPWTDEQRSAFVRHQFAAQSNHYRTEFPGAQHSILLKDQAPIGMLYIDFTHADVKIVDLIISPSSRNLGIGSSLLKVLQSEASRLQKPLTVFVDQHDRSIIFFDRLGFKPVEEQGMHILLEWKAT